MTDYVLQAPRGGIIRSGVAVPSAEAYDEMGKQFESIEKQVFGDDGSENPLKQVTSIEGEPGLSDIAQFTIQKPPK